MFEQNKQMQMLNVIGCEDNHKKTKYTGLLSFSCSTAHIQQRGGISKGANFFAFQGMIVLTVLSVFIVLTVLTVLYVIYKNNNTYN